MRNILRAFSFISLGGLLFGYVIGITSNVISRGQLVCSEHPAPSDATSFVQLKPLFVQLATALDEVIVLPSAGSLTSTGYDQCYDLDALSTGLLTASSLIGACLASAFCFRYADGFGRRLEIQITASLYFLGAIIAAASPSLWGIGGGFLIYGLGIGFAMHAGPAYIGEIAPAHIRGTLLAAKEGMIVLGTLLGFLSGYAFSGIEPWGWRCMTFVASILAFIMGLGMQWIPESPRWLELHNLPDAALSSMQFFREDMSLEEVGQEMAAIREDTSRVKGISGWSATFQYPRPMLIGCGLVFLQQVTGQPSVLYFSTSIFKAVGFGTQSAISSVCLGVAKLLATLFAVSVVDSYGRRSLLFLGIGMMTMALIAMAVSMRSLTCDLDTVSLWNCPEASVHIPHVWSIVLLLSLMVYVSGYQVGFGPMSWLVIAEVFPLHVKSSAISVALLVNFSMNIVMTVTQPTLLTELGASGLFSLYSVFSALSFLFVWIVVPETRGKTLEDITAELSPLK